jgi:hypothetical protein
MIRMPYCRPCHRCSSQGTHTSGTPQAAGYRPASLRGTLLLGTARPMSVGTKPVAAIACAAPGLVWAIAIAIGGTGACRVS